MAAGPTIVRADQSHLGGIERCAKAAYRRYVARIGREPAPMVVDFATQIDAGQVWVATDEEGIAGYAVYYPRSDHMHLENVAVLPDRQGRGIGRALIDHVEEKAREQRLAAVELYTNEKMTENLRLYPRLGYRETGRHSEDGFNRVFFRKEV